MRKISARRLLIFINIITLHAKKHLMKLWSMPNANVSATIYYDLEIYNVILQFVLVSVESMFQLLIYVAFISAALLLNELKISFLVLNTTSKLKLEKRLATKP